MIASVKNNTDKVQIDVSRMLSFEKILSILEGQLLEGRIFQVKNSLDLRFSLGNFLLELCRTNLRYEDIYH